MFSSFASLARSASLLLNSANDSNKKLTKRGGRWFAFALGALCLMAMVPLVTRAQNNPVSIVMPGGDFEAPVYGASPFYGYQPANSEWMWSGLAGIQRNGSTLGASAAPSGQQTAFLQGSGSPGNQGAFSGNVTLAAGTYRVTFRAAQRATGNGVPIQIKMDGTIIGAPITPTTTSFVTYASQPFKVSAGNGDRPYRLGFSTSSGSGVSMSLIDTIAVETVPTLSSSGFEAPVYETYPYYGYQPTNSGWNWSGMAGIQRNGGMGANAPEGVQTAFLQGASQPGSFSQSIPLSAGSYKVTFKAARRSNDSVTPIQVSINSYPAGSTVTLAPITPSSPAFAAYSTETFTLTSGSHLVSFSTTSVGGTSFSLIDDISIESVSSPAVVLPAPVAPTNPSNLVADAKTGRVTLTWTGSSGATAYKVKRAISSSGPYITFDDNLTATTYTDTTVSNGQTYYYRVYAYNASNTSEDTNQVAATPLAVPVVTAVSGVKRIDLTWSAVPGATSYRVFVAPSFIGEVPVNGTSASHTSLNSGTGYGYKVVAYAANGSSDGASVSKMTLSDAPTVSLTVYGASTIGLNWNSVVSATSYRVKRSTANGGPYTTLHPVITNTGFADTGLTPGTTYYYRVFAVNAGGNGPDSEQKQGTTFTPISSAPANLTATAGDGQVTLNWNAVANATSYGMKRSTTDGGPYTRFGYVITGTAFIDSYVASGTTYYYRVYANNPAGDGPDSDQASATLKRADDPIRQGGFETPNLPAGNYQYTNVAGSDWTFDHGSGIATNGSAFNIAKAPEGVQVAFVQATGSIKQSVTFSAGTYALRFRAAARDGLPHSYAIKIDGVTIDTLSQSNHPSSGYQQVTSSAFTVTAGAHEVQIAGLANVDRTVLVDDVQTITTAPTPPLNLTATAGDRQVTLNWNTVIGATGYKIKRGTTNGGPYTTLSTPTTAKSFVDTGLTNNTTYYYRVYAINQVGDGSDSDQASATPKRADDFIRQGSFETPNLPAGSYQYTNVPGSDWSFDGGSGIASQGSAFNIAKAPEGVQVAFVQATGSIRQSMTFGAGTYALRFKAAARDGLPHNYAIKIDGVTLDTLSQSNHPSSGYQQVTSSAFTVTAGAHEVQIAGLANVDRTVLVDDVQTITTAPTPPSAPTNVQAVAGDKSVVLTWTAGSGARDYEVYAGTAPNALASVGTVSALTFPHGNLTNGTTYYYRVFARNASGSSPQSDPASATPIGKPLNLTATAGDRQVVLKWDAVSGATGYKIKRSTTDGSSYTTLNTTATTNSFTDSVGLSNGTPYYYRVYAINVVGVGPDSDQASATPKAGGVGLAAPTGLEVENDSEQVLLRWEAVSGAKGYKVKRSMTEGGTYTTFEPTGTFPNYTDTDVLPSTRYYYRVYAFNDTDTGPDSDQVETLTVPAKTNNLTATLGNGQITLNWTAVDGADGYSIYVRTTTTGSYSLVRSVTPNTFVHTGLENGRTYQYYVAAYNDGGNGPGSNLVSATPTAPVTPVPPGVPTLSEKAGDAQVTLTWSPVNGADSYSVKKSLTAGGPFSTIASVAHPITTYIDKAVSNGTVYFYRVSATNSAGEGLDSDQVASKPTKPAPPLRPLMFSNITEGQTLSGEVFVSVKASAGYVKREDINFSVDGMQAGLVSLQGQPDNADLTSIALSTERFANGTHTLTLGDNAGNSDQVSVTFQNDVSSLSFASIMDLNTSTSDVPHNCRVTANVTPGVSVSVKILDEDQNVFRSFPTTTGNIDVVWDGKGDNPSAVADGSYFLSVNTSTSSASRQPSESSTKEITFDGGSTGIEIPLALQDRALGEVEIEDIQGRTIRVLRFNKQNSVVVWDGRDEDGNAVRSGSYKAVFASSQESVLSAPLTVIDPIKGIINVDSIRDSLILISSDAVHAAGAEGTNAQESNKYVAAMAYAKKVVIQARRRAGAAGSFVQTPQALIVTPTDMATGAALVNRIDNHFRARKVFIYVLAHGGWNKQNGRTYFVLDPNTKHYWYSSYYGTAPAGITIHDMDQLTAPLNYGDRNEEGINYTDPPKLVWMDHCQSGGSYYEGTLLTGYTEKFKENDSDAKYNAAISDIRYADSSYAWTYAFGIDEANGFEGAFIGWSGYMYLPSGQGTQWDFFRGDVLNNVFGSRNIFTSLRAAEIADRGRGNFLVKEEGEDRIANPRSRVRIWGTGSTSF